MKIHEPCFWIDIFSYNIYLWLANLNLKNQIYIKIFYYILIELK